MKIKEKKKVTVGKIKKVVEDRRSYPIKGKGWAVTNPDEKSSTLNMGK